ncbi:acyl-CoA synthetase (AMP-forming)/AMP-acid ligase II [Mycolicibacterium sp. BK556]|uniref:class I adenylate-forming enzyme family protein n=1 Tax=Mycobacteriaceae TaxID=1762 RepID=UPI00105D306E|nr:class I adenylate-forming enzyme family protein [Mycobacterium sp. BK086]MBB3602877.1 acyl-CoA synthetase (AMP-forming)/AMP-acid ligase II [Mycolicibacterium sp. BK556]MBB3633072.1 acyl-CoA synthetase (AMP-forming)/AMP-acid ligase II [Mycolicibacterium sp. BK607]TDO07047.1 acyl-CoA synthetase (AMP-forming)/AMP-acid ligase II [Mycobacterium sp. BK086]
MSDVRVLAFEDRIYTRSQVDACSAGLADTLARRGVQAGQRVAVMSSNRPEFVFAVLAIWRLGASAVLISPSWKSADVGHALEIAAADHAVGDNPVLADAMPMLSLDEPILPLDPAPWEPDPDADAVLVFSSGTTGMPKAVRHTHRSLSAGVRHWRQALGLTAVDRMQIVTPPSHILGLLNILTVLDAGAWMRLHRRFDIDTMLHTIQDDRITVEMAVAPIALAIASHPKLESFDLSSLRYIMWCATPVTASVADEVTRRTGVGWISAYGTSEVPVIACCPRNEARLDTVGRPIPQVRIVSTETGEPVGAGETGEIQVYSDSAMAGYLPTDATAGAFTDDWYRTGDIGYLDDGWLRITDRLKEMIKVRGFQVAPVEIESVLHGHPAVADCAVFGVPDEKDGEAVIAAVATAEPVGAEELDALIAEKLASYKRPRDIVFVPEIPRLPSGKALRRVLKEQYGCTSDQ